MWKILANFLHHHEVEKLPVKENCEYTIWAALEYWNMEISLEYLNMARIPTTTKRNVRKNKTGKTSQALSRFEEQKQSVWTEKYERHLTNNLIRLKIAGNDADVSWKNNSAEEIESK